MKRECDVPILRFVILTIRKAHTCYVFVDIVLCLSLRDTRNIPTHVDKKEKFSESWSEA